MKSPSPKPERPPTSDSPTSRRCQLEGLVRQLPPPLTCRRLPGIQACFRYAANTNSTPLETEP